MHGKTQGRGRGMGREKRRKLGGLGIVFVGILIVMGFFIAMLVKNIIGLHVEQNELKTQEAQLTEKRDELTEELKNVDDLEYIEEQARKLLRMIKPGEVLYITDDVTSSEASAEETEEDASQEEESPNEDGDN